MVDAMCCARQDDDVEKMVMRKRKVREKEAGQMERRLIVLIERDSKRSRIGKKMEIRKREGW